MRLDPESSLYFSHFQLLSFSSDIFIKLGFALAFKPRSLLQLHLI
eukprot:UN04954